MAPRFEAGGRLGSAGIVNTGGGGGTPVANMLFGIADQAQRFSERDRQEARRKEAAVISRTLVDADTALAGFASENEQDPDAFKRSWDAYSQRTLAAHQGEMGDELAARLYGMGGKAELVLRKAVEKKADEQASAAHIANIDRMADALAQNARTTGRLDDPDSRQSLDDIETALGEVERLGGMKPGDAEAFRADLRDRLAGQSLAGQTEAIWRGKGYSAALAHAESVLTAEGPASPESRAKMRDAAVARINELQNETDRKTAEFERKQAKARREAEAVIGSQLDVMLERGTDPSDYWNANKGRLDPVTRKVMGDKLQIAGIRRQRAVEKLYAERAAMERKDAADRQFVDSVIDAEQSFIAGDPVTTVELDEMRERGVFAGREDTYLSLYKKSAAAWDKKAADVQADIEAAVKLEQDEAITQLETLVQDGKLTDPVELDRLREMGVFKGRDEKFVSLRGRVVTKAKEAGEDGANLASFQASFASGKPILAKASSYKAADKFLQQRGIEVGNDEQLPELANVIQRTGVVPQQARDGFELAVTSRDPAALGYWAKLFGALDGDRTSGAILAGQLDAKVESFWRDMAAAAPVGRLEEVADAAYQRIFRGGNDSRERRDAERDQAGALSTAGEALRQQVNNEFDSWLPLDAPGDGFADDPRLRTAYEGELARREAAGDKPERAAEQAYRRVREMWGPTEMFGEPHMVQYPLEEWYAGPPGDAAWTLDQLAVDLHDTLVKGSMMDGDRELSSLTTADFRDMIDDGRVRLRPTSNAALAVKGSSDQGPRYVVDVDLAGGIETLGDGEFEGGWRPDWNAPTNPYRAIWDRAGMESAAAARKSFVQQAADKVKGEGPGVFGTDQRSVYFKLLNRTDVYDESLARIHGERLPERLRKMARRVGAGAEAVREHIAGP